MGRQDMNAASAVIGVKELMPVFMDKAYCSQYYGYNGDWDGKIIQKVLEDKHFECICICQAGSTNSNSSPGAGAWIADKGGHWFAYTQTPNGSWFNVDSNFENSKHSGTGPRWIGDEAAVLKEIESHRKEYSNYTLYRVSLPAQQSHGAAPVKSQAKDDEEHKSASPICSDAESVMGDDILGEDGDTESLGDKEAPVAPPAIPQAQQEQKSAEAHTSTIPQQKPKPTKPVMA